MRADTHDGPGAQSLHVRGLIPRAPLSSHADDPKLKARLIDYAAAFLDEDNTVTANLGGTLLGLVRLRTSASSSQTKTEKWGNVIRALNIRAE